MLVCNRFVFLHLHKSGGTYINNMMMQCIPYARQLGYHLPYSALPKSYRKLPVVGTVRNPWAYYVSWYHFQSQKTKPNQFFMTMSDKNTLSFEATITRLLSLDTNEELFEQTKLSLPTEFENHGLNLTQDCILPLKNSGLGFYSFLYNRLYHGADGAFIIKVESLKNSLAEAMNKFNVESKVRIKRFLEEAPVMNASKHKAYQQYYSTNLQQLVAAKESKIIDEYDYSF